MPAWHFSGPSVPPGGKQDHSNLSFSPCKSQRCHIYSRLPVSTRAHTVSKTCPRYTHKPLDSQAESHDYPLWCLQGPTTTAAQPKSMLMLCNWSELETGLSVRNVEWNLLSGRGRWYVRGWASTLVESELFMYGSAQWLIPPWSTFSMRATRKISGWGHVTENTPCGNNSYLRTDSNLVFCKFCLVVMYFIPTCRGYCMAVSGTPRTTRCPSGWASPPPFIYWLLLVGIIPLTDGWLRSTWKSEEIFLPFWMSNNDRVT